MSMSSYGLEIAFWTILSIYVLSRLGLLKKWQKCLKSYNGYTGRRNHPIGGVKTCPPDLWSDEVPVIARDLQGITRVNQLTQPRGWSINAGRRVILTHAAIRARGLVAPRSLAICSPTIWANEFSQWQPGIWWGLWQFVDWFEDITDTPWYTEIEIVCFTFTLLISPFRVREINKLNDKLLSTEFRDNKPELDI